MKTICLTLFLFYSFLTVAQVSETINLAVAGTLQANLVNDFASITNLTVTGNIDKRDFSFMNSSMVALTHIDLSGATIKAYSSYSENQVPNSAFGGKSLLKEVILPENTTWIYDFAFNACSGLTAITLPSTLVNIGYGVFDKCTGLQSIIIPATVQDIKSSAFWGCASLNSISVETANSHYSSIDGSLYNYNQSKLVIVKGATTGVFNIPESVTSVETYAFSKCSGIVEITVPAALTIIPISTFNSCSGLNAITVDAANSTFKSVDGVLYNKSGSTLLRVPENKSFTNYSIPSDVELINSYAMFHCSNIQGVTIPTSVTTIKYNALTGCTGLTSLSIPNSVTTLEDNSIKQCTNLTTLNLSSQLALLADYTFTGCTALETVTIPSNITTLGQGVFSSCSKLATIDVSSVTEFGVWCFANCIALQTVNLSANLIAISDYGFINCTALETLVLPSGLLTIGESSFEGCVRLNNLTIPSTVATIDNMSFKDCSGFTVLTVESETPVDLTIQYNVFQNVTKRSCTLYVPNNNAVSNYYSAYEWQNFNIQVTIPTSTNVASSIDCVICESNGGVIIEGVTTRTKVFVYDIDGRLLMIENINEGKKFISLSDKGVYIVKVGNVLKKIRI